MSNQQGKIDQNQVIESVYDKESNALRTTAVASDSTDETTAMDEASSTVLYVGSASAGSAQSAPSWKIKKIVTSGNITTVTYPDGDPSYLYIWANRTSLTYS